MGKFAIQVAAGNCTGCLRCQLACSDAHGNDFNPAAARIRVVMTGADCRICFTKDCDACGICVDHCFYEALTKLRKEAE